MRLLYLYLRSRRVDRYLTLLAGLVLAVWAWRIASGGDGPSAGPPLVILPLAAAVIVLTGTSTPFGHLEATASRPLGPLRLMHMLGLLVVAALGLSVTIGSVDVAIIRNVAGLTGLGLIAARVVGPSIAWVAPLCYGIYALAISPGSVSAWPVHSGSELRPALIAASLSLAGLVAIVPNGAPIGPGTSE